MSLNKLWIQVNYFLFTPGGLALACLGNSGWFVFIIDIVSSFEYEGYYGIEYEGLNISEEKGILQTKKLLERNPVVGFLAISLVVILIIAFLYINNYIF